MYRRIIKLDTSVDKRKCITQWSQTRFGQGRLYSPDLGYSGGAAYHKGTHLCSNYQTGEHQEPFDFLNGYLCSSI